MDPYVLNGKLTVVLKPGAWRSPVVSEALKTLSDSGVVVSFHLQTGAVPPPTNDDGSPMSAVG